MAAEIRSVLRAAAERFELIEFTRNQFEPGLVSHGFILDVQGQWVLLQKFTDRLDLDGYQLLRLQDMTSVATEFRKKEFYLRALTLKAIHPERPNGVVVDPLPRAIASISGHFHLLVLSREATCPDEVLVGSVTNVAPTGLKLRWISATAEWLPREEFYAYSSITRIEFGGEYERTLHLVARGDSVS